MNYLTEAFTTWFKIDGKVKRDETRKDRSSESETNGIEDESVKEVKEEWTMNFFEKWILLDVFGWK